MHKQCTCFLLPFLLGMKLSHTKKNVLKVLFGIGEETSARGDRAQTPDQTRVASFCRYCDN